ncbi:MAG: hypothetical protein ABJA70_24315 [Chryseolinea sp.]
MSIKKYTLLFSMLTLSALSIVNAQSKSEVFKKEEPVTWLGLDFSHNKFIGDREKFGSESDVRKLMEAWNDLIIKEADKYNIAKAIDRSKVEYAVEVTNEHNAEQDVMSMFSDSEKDYLHLKVADVEQLISGYDFKGKTGIGLMFVVESFNKTNVEGSVFVTFINMGTREVLFTERVTAEPGGFGMRNYWAGSIREVIEKIRKKDFSNWRKKYFRP